MLSCVGLPTFGPKQVAVAGNVAVGDAVMLGPRDRETERERETFSVSLPPSFPPSPHTHHPGRSPRRVSQASTSSGSAGTSDRDGANFCLKTSTSQLELGRDGSSVGVQGALPAGYPVLFFL